VRKKELELSISLRGKIQAIKEPRRYPRRELVFEEDLGRGDS